MGYKCSAIDDLMDHWHKTPGVIDKVVKFTEDVGIDFKLVRYKSLPFNEKSFDMIMIHHVLEHLHDSPKDLLINLLKLLSDDGYLFITVPNAVNIRKRINVIFGKINLPTFDSYYWYPGEWRGHVREYVIDDLKKLSHFLNLEIIELYGCDHMISRLNKKFRKPYLLITRVFPTWKDSLLLLAKKKSGWEPKDELPENELQKNLGKSVC